MIDQIFTIVYTAILFLSSLPHLLRRNDADITSRGYFNLEKVGEATGPTYFDANGDLKCGVDANTSISSDCVPLNIFSEGSVTPEMLQYISGTKFELDIIGTGSLESELRKFAMDNEIQANFLGQINFEDLHTVE